MFFYICLSPDFFSLIIDSFSCVSCGFFIYHVLFYSFILSKALTAHSSFPLPLFLNTCISSWLSFFFNLVASGKPLLWRMSSSGEYLLPDFCLLCSFFFVVAFWLLLNCEWDQCLLDKLLTKGCTGGVHELSSDRRQLGLRNVSHFPTTYLSTWHVLKFSCSGATLGVSRKFTYL